MAWPQYPLPIYRNPAALEYAVLFVYPEWGEDCGCLLDKTKYIKSMGAPSRLPLCTAWSIVWLTSNYESQWPGSLTCSRCSGRKSQMVRTLEGSCQPRRSAIRLAPVRWIRTARDECQHPSNRTFPWLFDAQALRENIKSLRSYDWFAVLFSISAL